jgi:hypothetical protein
LERLGSRAGAEYVSGATVIFVAPLRGRSPHVIVGWYRNATIYRSYQNAPRASNRVAKGKQIGFNLAAAHKDSVLLPVDDRVFQVPRGKGGIGQARLWYADQPRQRKFLQKVREYIKTRKPPLPYTGHAKSHGGGWQPDLAQRQRVERAAVRAVWDHFAAHGYALRSVERLNCGWDLEATFRDTTFCLEVKGTSGLRIECEVTPNEYLPIREMRPAYRLCIVCDALGKRPIVRTFAWSRELKGWCFEGQRLSVKELTGARLFA